MQCLWNGANRKDALVRVHQTHLESAAGPIRAPTRRAGAGRLGPKKLRKGRLGRLRHFRTQSALQMCRVHVLRPLVQSHGGRGCWGAMDNTNRNAKHSTSPSRFGSSALGSQVLNLLLLKVSDLGRAIQIETWNARTYSTRGGRNPCANHGAKDKILPLERCN
jgi:hypothetical protein